MTKVRRGKHAMGWCKQTYAANYSFQRREKTTSKCIMNVVVIVEIIV